MQTWPSDTSHPHNDYMTPAARGATVAAWWPWLVLPALATALVSTGVVLDLATGDELGGNPEAWVNAPLAIGFATVAAGIWSTRPGPAVRRLAVVYTVVGLASAMVIPAHAWAHVGLVSVPGDLPATTFAAWVSNWIWALGAAPLMGLGILLYPDGRLPGRRWWPALVLGTAAPVVLALSGALRPGRLEALPSTTNPLGVGTVALWDLVGGIAFVTLLVAAVLGLVALAMKFRAAPRRGDVRHQIGGFLIAAALVILAASLPDGTGPGQLLLALTAGIALPATVGNAVVRHRLLDQRADVEQLNRRLDTMAESRRAIVSDREDERQRLRRDLHDGLGPSLAAIGLGLRQLQADLPPGNEASTVGALGDEVQRAVVEVRRLCEDLSPAALTELGLGPAIEAATDRLGAFGGPAISVSLGALPQLPAAVEVATFRVVMEATTNAFRHSGASRIEVGIEWADGVTVTVEDDGTGVDPTRPPGVGRRAMADRADELGGWVRSGPGSHGGTRVLAWLPAGEGV